MKLRPFKHAPSLIALAIIAIVCLLRISNPNWVERLERMTYDSRVRAALKHPTTVATNLGFVFIDEESIHYVRTNRALGYHFGLYWPRQIYGRVIQELALQGAKACAMDVVFGDIRDDHPSVTMADGRSLESDEFFALQLQFSSNVILAVTKEVVPPPLFYTNAASVGDITAEKDFDGILRRAQAFRIQRKWHLAFRQAAADPEYGIDLGKAVIENRAIALKRSNGEQIRVPLDENGNFDLADFVGDKIPAGMERIAKPFTEEKIWHMGVVMAARQLHLDLNKADIDLGHGRITLAGPDGVQRVIPVDEHGYFYINWSMGVEDPRLLQQPIQELLSQNWERLQGTNTFPTPWAGRLAVIGSRAVVGNDLTDRGATPLSKDTVLVSKHWNVANSVLTGQFVKRSSLAVDLGLIVLLGCMAAFFTWELPALFAFGAVVATMTAYVALSSLVYINSRLWIPIILPGVCASLMTHVCVVTWRVVFEEAERRRIRSIFSGVVSPKIVKELLSAESLSLGGARREITVLFADVRGFTEFTDKSQDVVAEFVRKNKLEGPAAEKCFDMQARETLATVNRYLGLVADVIVRFDGTLDKFIGDCVMAFWGAPTPNESHASMCVKAAIEAQRAVYALNQQRTAENNRRKLENETRVAAGLEPLPLMPVLLLGTGINSGMATAGLMGSQAQQKSYTVFGREVNLASRLEGLSGRGRIYISESTYQCLVRTEPELAKTCVAQALQKVKGIHTALLVYEVPWMDTEAGIQEAMAATLEQKTIAEPNTEMDVV